MSNNSVVKKIVIPIHPFGYYCTIFNIDLQDLSNNTGIPVTVLEIFKKNGLKCSSISERVAIAQALGVPLSDISEERQKGERIKPEW